MKGGTVVDLDEAEHAIRLAVDAAERMAGVQVEGVIVNATGGRLASHLYDAQVQIVGGSVSDGDVHRVLEACVLRTSQSDRSVLHSIPTSYSLGTTRNISDPRGMMGDALGAAMHVLSCDRAAARNLMLAVERCHLKVEALVATPYASGLAALVEDESELGTALIDMGGGTTSVAIFTGGSLTHVDAFAVGGIHVTMDIARGLNVRLADAERLKTLYGTCLASVSDERETIAVTQVGDDGDHATHLPKSHLVRIIRPRVEEILEFVRDRLKTAGFPTPRRAPHRADRGREPAHGHERGRQAHPDGAGAGRPADRHQGSARIRTEPGLSAALGLLVYPPGERHRALSARPRRAARGRHRLHGPRGSLAEGQFLASLGV